MTVKDGKPTEDVPYGFYEGKPIRELGVEVTNTSGGLNAAMRLRGRKIHPDERLPILYDVQFAKHRYDPINDGEAWKLVTIGSAQTAAILEEGAEAEAIAEVQAEQRRMADEKHGRAQLDDEELGLLATAHGLGAHNEEKVDGCPLCEERVEDDELDPAEREVREKLQDGGTEPKAGRGRKVKDDPQA